MASLPSFYFQFPLTPSRVVITQEWVLKVVVYLKVVMYKTEGGGSLNLLFHPLLGGQAVLAVTLVPTMKGSCGSD